MCVTFQCDSFLTCVLTVFCCDVCNSRQKQSGICLDLKGLSLKKLTVNLYLSLFLWIVQIVSTSFSSCSLNLNYLVATVSDIQ